MEIACSCPMAPLPARHVLIDGGRTSTYSFLKPALRKIVESNERLELLVLTHIDADHIEGLLPLVADDELGLDIKEIWFNGYDQLFDFERLGFAQADALSDALRAKGLKPNNRFSGEALMIPENGPLPRIELDGGMSLTLLSPDCARLEKLRKEWAMWRGMVQATPKPEAAGATGLEVPGPQTHAEHPRRRSALRRKGKGRYRDAERIQHRLRRGAKRQTGLTGCGCPSDPSDRKRFEVRWRRRRVSPLPPTEGLASRQHRKHDASARRGTGLRPLPVFDGWIAAPSSRPGSRGEDSQILDRAS